MLFALQHEFIQALVISADQNLIYKINDLAVYAFLSFDLHNAENVGVMIGSSKSRFSVSDS